MRAAFLLMFPLFLPGCDAVPADPEQTLARVKESGQLRVGIVEGTHPEAIEGFVQIMESKTGASAEPGRGDAEHLLKKLKNGQLDIVIGPFARKSPWRRQVWLSKALDGGDPADDEPVLRAAARNGENRWIMAIAETVKQQ
ncbi:hypothetical protein [Parasphingorhabdus sp.]|uniref:hypothetical protein n=1 Tax=Parasphingorhabdus sp. TaxID=2709688 RepID=UPI002F9564A0